MNLLSEKEKDLLENQIREIEKQTSGELLTVITRSSDDYRYISLFWAALAALCVPGLFFLFDQLTQDGRWNSVSDMTDFSSIYLLQVAVFAGLASLFIWAPFRMSIIPTSTQTKRASALAHELFEREVDSHRDGENQQPTIMLFVSLAEKHVEIMVNDIAANKIPDGLWQSAIDDFIEHVQLGNVSDGFSNALANCGHQLIEHFPPNTNDPMENRYSDRLLEI